MKCIKYFVFFAGVILLVSAVTRFLIVLGNSQVLSLPEPMLRIPLRYATLSVGMIELVVASLCLFGNRIRLQAICVACLAVNYGVYRIGAMVMGGHQQATAIGGLTDPLQLAGGVTGALVALAPVSLVLGASGQLLGYG